MVAVYADPVGEAYRPMSLLCNGLRADSVSELVPSHADVQCQCGERVELRWREAGPWVGFLLRNDMRERPTLIRIGP
jgi:hypothetical protein